MTTQNQARLRCFEGIGVTAYGQCRADRGAQIDNERLAMLERAGFDSLTKVDHMAGFDRVLAELAALTRPRHKHHTFRWRGRMLRVRNSRAG